MFVLNSWHYFNVQQMPNRTATPYIVEVLPCPTRSMGASECRPPCGAFVFIQILLAQVAVPWTSSRQRNHHVGVGLSWRFDRVPTPICKTLVEEGAFSLVGSSIHSAVVFDEQPEMNARAQALQSLAAKEQAVVGHCCKGPGCRW